MFYPIMPIHFLRYDPRGSMLIFCVSNNLFSYLKSGTNFKFRLVMVLFISQFCFRFDIWIGAILWLQQIKF